MIQINFSCQQDPFVQCPKKSLLHTKFTCYHLNIRGIIFATLMCIFCTKRLSALYVWAQTFLLTILYIYITVDCSALFHTCTRMQRIIFIHVHVRVRDMFCGVAYLPCTHKRECMGKCNVHIFPALLLSICSQRLFFPAFHLNLH